MSILNSSEGSVEGENPAVTRLEALAKELQNCQKECMGKDAEWDNSVANKIIALQTALQTVRKHEDLPDGMTLKTFEESVRGLISQRP